MTNLEKIKKWFDAAPAAVVAYCLLGLQATVRLPNCCVMTALDAFDENECRSYENCSDCIRDWLNEEEE